MKQSSTVAAATSNPSNSNGADQPVVVRLAKDGEFPPDPPPAEGRRRLARMDCAKSGRPMDVYYAPVVAFAREHFIGNEHGTVHEALVTTGAQTTLRDGLDVVVEPRETLGELRIVSVGPPFYAPGDKWAETGYCLHVMHDGGITTIVVEKAWSWIK